MNTKNCFKLNLNLIWLGILMISTSCSESPSPDSRQPMKLKMDIPQPKRLAQSPIKSKSVPIVEKSDLDFKTNPNPEDLQIDAISIHDHISCLKEVVALEMSKDRIQKNGGLWGAMEQTENFKEYSPVGMQIDSKINKIAHSFRHLCKTAKGLDYSPLAKFVLENLKHKTEEEFKHEMIKKGEPAADIEIYINYTRDAQKAKNRSIRYSAIQPSMVRGRLFIEYYQVFYNRLQKTENKSIDSLMPDIMAFKDALDSFLSEDQNIKIAVKEDSEKPFWMIDGDM